MNEITAKNVAAERDLLLAVYQAFNRREVDSILAVMHPQVEWPNGIEGGWLHGHEAVRAYWKRQWSLLDPYVEPIRIEPDGGGRMIVDVHQVVRGPSWNCARGPVRSARLPDHRRSHPAYGDPGGKQVRYIPCRLMNIFGFFS